MNNGLDLMHARLNIRGGGAQQDRMIKDKRETLDRVLKYSYQGADVVDIKTGTAARALINPNKLKPDYDDKIISIGYEHGFGIGTIFEWINNTKWLIYLQDLTELAYFLGDIRKCNYIINWEDADGAVHSTYAAVRGPVETKITPIQKNGISLDVPNHSVNILLPNEKGILEYFKRYSKFYLMPLHEGDSPICWRIEATDTLSTPGILEITGVEYYANETEDDIENGIVGAGVYVKPVPAPASDVIEGPEFIKPKLKYTYTYLGNDIPNWSYDTKLPLDVEINGNQITLSWKTTYTGVFSIFCNNKEKGIIVESLF